VSTREPRRLREVLAGAAREAGLAFQELTVVGADQASARAEFARRLEQVLGAEDGEPGLVLVQDAFHYLDCRPLLRRVLEGLPALRAARRHLVLVAELDRFPEELSGVVRRLRFPLPSVEERLALLEAAAGARGRVLPTGALERSATLLSGLAAEEAQAVFAEAMTALEAGAAEDLPALVKDLKVEAVRRTRYLDLAWPTDTLSDLGGLDLLKDWLRHRTRAFQPEARRFGLPEPRGVLLVGVQGCGKSLAAKVMASVFGLPLVRLDSVALFAGDAPPEQGIREILDTCDNLAPVILWIDELDKLFFSLGSGGAGADQGTLSRVFAAFLTWMQERRSAVFVAATANAVDRLPPELLRKGRFDEIFFVDLPGVLEREEILRIHLTRRGRQPGSFDLPDLARRACYFSGAELEQVVVGGLYRAFDANRELEQADLKAEIEATVPLYLTAEDAIKELRDFCRTRARRATSQTDMLDLFRRKG
jgi:hypothetical protein